MTAPTPMQMWQSAEAAEIHADDDVIYRELVAERDAAETKPRTRAKKAAR